MSKVTRAEDSVSRLLRSVSESSAVSFGSHIPWNPGPVRFYRIGFADIGAVGFDSPVRNHSDASGLVPEARQHILRACAEKGLPTHTLNLRVSVGVSTRRRFRWKDAKTGKGRLGYSCRFYLEISDYRLRRVFRDALGESY